MGEIGEVSEWGFGVGRREGSEVAGSAGMMGSWIMIQYRLDYLKVFFQFRSAVLSLFTNCAELNFVYEDFLDLISSSPKLDHVIIQRLCHCLLACKC